MIDKFCEGYSISSPWEKIGYRGSEVYDIFLDDVKVTEDQILGKPGDGFTQLLGTTAYGKLASPPCSLVPLWVLPTSPEVLPGEAAPRQVHHQVPHHSAASVHHADLCSHR